jgi:hypothetical protein
MLSGHTKSRFLALWCVLLLGCLGAAFLTADDEPIDWNKARDLRQKQRAGQTLTLDEQQYLQRASEIRRSRQQTRGTELAQRDHQRLEPKPTLGFTPLTDFRPVQEYKGQRGGLYGEAHNEPPAEHRQAALRAASSIQPLDEHGHPDPQGKIVMISNGMSNTTGEFQVFVDQVQHDKDVNPKLVLIDAAQGGQDAQDWADPENRYRKDNDDPWTVQAQRLKQARITPSQVQVVWMKHARRNPAALGEFPDHAKELQRDQAVILRRLKNEFPNLKLAFLSSRIYAGYARTPLNPEPYAYESAWANQWLIRDQMSDDPLLNYSPTNGKVQAPVIVWGPYLWADGQEGRRMDDLVYLREDLASDGTHPSQSGKQKVSDQLLKFFKTSPFAKPWFVKQ